MPIANLFTSGGARRCFSPGLLVLLLWVLPGRVLGQGAQPDAGTAAVQPLTSTYAPLTVTAPALAFRQFDRVEITGSSIVRKEQTLSLPVQVITRAEIERSSHLAVADLLQALPVMSQFFNLGMLGAVQSGFSGAAIHGSQTGTLVLVNGRRLAGNGIQTTAGVDNGGIDLNWLPLSAIERIEVLTDGASSIYGTDAQTGVINLITRSDLPGVQFNYDQTLPEGLKGLGSRLGLSVGRGRLEREGYSWFVSADLLRQQALEGRDRPWASAGRHVVEHGGNTYWADGPAVVAAQTATTLASSRSMPWEKLWNAAHDNGRCPAGQWPAWGQQACLYNTYRDKDLYPSTEAGRVHAQGQWLLGPDATAYAEWSWQQTEHRRRYYGWGQYAARIGNSPQSPGHSLALAQGFDPAQGVWLLYSGAELGAGPLWFGIETQRLVTGIKGQWRGWHYNSAYQRVHSRNDFVASRLSAYPDLGVDSERVLTEPALLAPLVPGNPVLPQLQAMLDQRWPLDSGVHRIQSLDVKASRSLGEIAGRDVYLAVGSDWRLENADYDKLAPIARTTPSFQAQRSVWAQFAELQLPWSETLETIASLRNDRYSDFGNTTHGKLSARWSPDPRWWLRGSWGTSFRAPALAQMQETGRLEESYFYYPCSADLQAVATRLGGRCPADNLYWLVTQGSSRLKPELSQQLNLGLRFSPSRNHSLSIDYWRVDVRDRINYLTVGTIFSDLSRYANHLELGERGELQVYTPMMNVGRTRTSGLDLSWALRKPTDWGQLHLGMQGTRVLTSRYQLADGEPFRNDLNTTSAHTNFVMPRWKSRWQLGLVRAEWQGWLTLDHVGAYDGGAYDAVDVRTGELVTLPSHRVRAGWTLNAMAVHDWGRHTRLRLGIDNLPNRRAPVSFAYSSSFNFGTNPMLSQVWGRTLRLSLTHRF